MVDAAPFRALRYDPAVAGDPAATSAPAYDDLERFTFARHRTASPYTVLELLAPTAAAPAAFRAAGATFERWRRTGVLVEDPAPAFYLYEEHELRRGVPALQRGVLAAVRVGDPDVLPHEAVEPARVATRVERLKAVPADLAPVFALHLGGSPRLRAALDVPPDRPPVAALTDEAGVDHRVWAINDPRRLAEIRTALQDVRAVIADGHHRWEAARALRERRPGADRTLVYLVDADTYGPQVLAVHRVVDPLPADAPQLLASTLSLTPAPGEVATLAARLATATAPALGLWRPGSPGLVLTPPGGPAGTSLLPANRSPAWRGLDTALFEHVVLPRLGQPPVEHRTDAAAAAAQLERRGGGGLFLVRSVPVATVLACAAAGETMPAKTTWFRPKPRAGLIMRSLPPAHPGGAF